VPYKNHEDEREYNKKRQQNTTPEERERRRLACKAWAEKHGAEANARRRAKRDANKEEDNRKQRERKANLTPEEKAARREQNGPCVPDPKSKKLSRHRRAIER
jgi:hypothetical protein